MADDERNTSSAESGAEAMAAENFFHLEL